jgi:hypothetical protein
MNKKVTGFTILIIGMFVFVLSAANIGVAVASSELQVANIDCGGGSFKLDDLPDSWTEASGSWSSVDGFDCPYGIDDVSFEFKAGHYTGGPNECYGASWDQDGWSVWETGAGGCQNTSHVTISWTCNCAPPTETPVPPTETPVPPTETPVPPTETPGCPTPTPTEPPDDPTPTPTEPPDDPTPTPTEPPDDPTPTPVPPTETPVTPPTATPKPPDKPTGPGDTNALLWIMLLALGAGVSAYGARKIIVA